MSEEKKSNGDAVAIDPQEAFDGLVEAISEKCGWDHSSDSGVTTLVLQTSDERTQKVFIEPDMDIAGQPIARYWSVIGSAESLNYRLLLEENATFDYGTFAIRGENLVVMDTQLLVDADPLEVGTTITYLASNADRYEEAVFGVDEA